jgi:hypothetical protein
MVRDQLDGIENTAQLETKGCQRIQFRIGIRQILEKNPTKSDLDVRVGVSDVSSKLL